MKKRSFIIVGLSLVLVACGPNQSENQSSNDSSSKKENNVKHIATDKNVQGDNYRTILPFKESQARGLTQEKMSNHFNGEDFESGLLEISKEIYPTDDYLYQDGQFLDKKTIQAYLKPKLTKDELNKMSDKEKEEKQASENLGLNPSVHGEKDEEKIAKQSPQVLSHILEQNFYDNGDTSGKKVKGLTIGLAMNQVYYYQKEKYGETFSVDLDKKKVEKQGREIAEEMLSRLRENDQLKDVPITFAIYMQSGKDQIVPGSFVSYATSDENGAELKEWNKVKEQTVLMPSGEAADLNEQLNANFRDFNNNLQSYFTNFTQAVGKAKFKDKKVQSLSVDLPIDYYGRAELIGITQYVTQLAEKDFGSVDTYEIHIKDGNEPRALITKSKDDNSPKVHIYNQ
ncbi:MULTISPECIES: CamS family sex pheromone protein [Staphylococcus]|uniref:CamS family sex pheromone protein n=1 Tax=Staphylococcus agnetis TaxID=985762 RepID=A0A242VGH1_9STAP|nr:MULTISPECIES: CamS family sex pheromone protein [Staphylococcus]ALN76881.1 CamS family sex pheromone protein [Staphylococcus agnetis]MBY7664580.1 CamS family sex pheromone protein [Staphylococcus agnetis]MCO4326345.1 CamS family sex pheromone protein [Staphylococcus agnetis]MCO4357178.1 CamS family sex pheromone protein [Staphylococcus agnetis]MCO4362041.1 CamS family sex pheromone protein [Staphylococcus agnetis]